MSATKICPTCEQQSLVKHCDSKTCRWHKCLSKRCETVINLTTGIGFRSGGMAGWLPINLNDGGPR